MFEQIRMAREANRLRAEWDKLWESPAAYRPGPRQHHPHNFRAMHALTALANFANMHQMTSGDANVLGNALVRSIDEQRSYAAAFDDVMERVARGQIFTVSGHPMDRLAPAESVAAVLEMVCNAARPEAYAEYVLGLPMDGHGSESRDEAISSNPPPPPSPGEAAKHRASKGHIPRRRP